MSEQTQEGPALHIKDKVMTPMGEGIVIAKLPNGLIEIQYLDGGQPVLHKPENLQVLSSPIGDIVEVLKEADWDLIFSAVENQYIQASAKKPRGKASKGQTDMFQSEAIDI